MADNDEEARRKRAALLRQQIAGLKPAAKGGRRPADAVKDDGEKPATPESPRDFVHRRMREIDEEPKK